MSAPAGPFALELLQDGSFDPPFVTLNGTQVGIQLADCSVPPAVTCPGALTAGANGNCQSPVPDVLSSVTVTGGVGTPSLTQHPAAGSLLGLGTHTITVTATDTAGQSATCTTSFTVTDEMPPVPDLATLPDVAGQCSASILSAPTASDNCAGSLTGTTTDPLTYNSPGQHIVTWTYDDGHGNRVTQNQRVIVQDTTAPQITCPANITVACSVDQLLPVAFTLTATDNCDSAPTVVATPASGSLFAMGTTTVHCTATDVSGNQSECSFTVTRLPLGFDGFLSPIGGADATGGSFAAPVRSFKRGSTIPVKFSANCGGSPVVSGVHTLQAIKWTNDTTSDPPIDATPQDAATTGNQFRLTDGKWHFNLDTKATGMSVGKWHLVATLSEGSQHSVWIQVK